MTKISITLFSCLFVIGLLAAACDDELSDLFDICTRSDAEHCADLSVECHDALDPESDTYEEDQAACKTEQCDWLDNRECDQYMDEAGCE